MKTTTRNLITIASLITAIFGSAAVIAQPGPGRGPNANQPATQVQGRALERFQAADTDKNGALSKEEVTKGMPRMGERFAALDTNQDGKITTEEFQTMRNNVQGAGRPQGAGPGQMQGNAQGGRMAGQRGGMQQTNMRGQKGGMQKTGMRGQGGLIQADADKDGVITRTEAEKFTSNQMLARFDTLDTDKDGKLSPAELAARQGKRR